MGRLLRREVVAITCNLRTCAAREGVGPYRLEADWVEMVADYARLVDAGWVFILNDTLRSYCPQHAAKIWDCSCVRHKHYWMYCPQHCDEAKNNVWTAAQVPPQAEKELARFSRIGV